MFGVSHFLFYLGFTEVFIHLYPRAGGGVRTRARVPVCFSLTLEAEHSKSLRGVWVSRLVFVLVERADPQQASSTLRPGDGDGVAHAAVGEPAVITAVQPLAPSSKQLSR